MAGSRRGKTVARLNKPPIEQTALLFRWANADGSKLEQWNRIKQRWMSSERRIYLDCLHRFEAIIMNPAEDYGGRPLAA